MIHKNITKPTFALIMGVFVTLFIIVNTLHQQYTTKIIPGSILTITRDQAKEIAYKALSATTIDPNAWYPIIFTGEKHWMATIQQYKRYFVYDTNKKLYPELMSTYLLPAFWFVRWVKFEGTELERAEEYRMMIDGAGNIIETAHVLPEAAPANSITEEQARTLAQKTITQHFGLPLTTLHEINVTALQKPHRIDWQYIAEDTNYQTALGEGKACVVVYISGDTVTNISRVVDTPAQWGRTIEATRSVNLLIKALCTILFILFIILAGRSLPVNPHPFSWIITFLLLLIITIINGINNFPLYLIGFVTNKPFTYQLIPVMIGACISIVGTAAILTLIIKALKGMRANGLFAHNTSKYEEYSGIIPGMLIGALIVYGEHFCALWMPLLSPAWADYSMLGSYLPSLTFGITYIFNYLCMTMIFVMGSYYIDTRTSNYTGIIKTVLYFIITTLFMISVYGATNNFMHASGLLSHAFSVAFIITISMLLIGGSIITSIIPFIMAAYMFLSMAHNIGTIQYPGLFTALIITNGLIFNISLILKKKSPPINNIYN